MFGYVLALNIDQVSCVCAQKNRVLNHWHRSQSNGLKPVIAKWQWQKNTLNPAD